MSEGPLHWVFGPHPWPMHHWRGLVWLVIALGWCLDAFMWWASVAMFHTGCGGVAQCAWDRGDVGPFGGTLVACVFVVATGLMVWQAEERRACPPESQKDRERRERERRIAEMETELGIR